VVEISGVSSDPELEEPELELEPDPPDPKPEPELEPDEPATAVANGECPATAVPAEPPPTWTLEARPCEL